MPNCVPSRSLFAEGIWKLCAITCFFLAGCVDSTVSSSGADGSSPKTLRVVATTNLIGDLVQQIAGDSVELVVLMGPGVDPHLYTPTRKDVKALLDADVVFFNGLHLEGRMAAQFEQLKRGDKAVYAVTEGLPENRLKPIGSGKGEFDPHIWMDAGLWSQCASIVADRLTQHDAPHAERYKTRLASYQQELAMLDAEIRQQIQAIPEERRVLVTAHDAFGYYGAAYGIDVQSVQGISTESEAGVRDINRLVNLIVERKLPVIFVETSVNARYVTAVQEAVQARGYQLQIGEALYSDSLGSAESPANTYTGMLRTNTKHITEGLLAK